MTQLPYIPTEYSVKPGIKKLGDENHFIIDELLPLYKNEKQDARAENLSEYYLERKEIEDKIFIVQIIKIQASISSIIN